MAEVVQDQLTATTQDILSTVVNLPINVGTKLERASVLKRGFAFLVDIIVILPVYVFFFFLLISTRVPDEEQITVTIFVIITLLLLLFISIGYFIYFETHSGKTFGKMLMRIKVVSVNGESCSVKQAIIRGVFRVVDVFIWPIVFFNKDRKRLGDIVAKTWVVKV